LGENGRACNGPAKKTELHKKGEKRAINAKHETLKSEIKDEAFSVKKNPGKGDIVKIF